MDENLNRRLAEVARIAVRLETETGVPARLLIAQWAVESRWGAKLVGDFNCFGIKLAARHTKSCSVMTREVVAGQERHLRLEFADYDSLEDACRDYAWLISHGDPYRAAWQRYREDGDFDAVIDGVARVYATDPGYAALLKRITVQANVTAAIQAAREVVVRA
jgi:flagellar protein FlgJ